MGTVKFTGSGSSGWKSDVLPGESVDVEFSTDGDGGSYPERRWGVFALLLPSDAVALPSEKMDDLIDKYTEVTEKAVGIRCEVQVERDDWDEMRIRALCERYGWEFEWMTEDGERRRRMKEQEVFLQDAAELVGAHAAASASAKAREAKALNLE